MQSVSTRSLYAATAASTNDAAHIDITVDAWIIGIDWAISVAAGATGDRVDTECSVQSVAAATTNDGMGIISRCSYCYTVTTSGATVPVNKFVGPTKLYLPAGTRVYLHTTQAGTSSTRIGCTLHLGK